MLFDDVDGFQLTDLARRLANIIRLGSIKAVDYQRARAQVTIGNLTTDWLPWFTACAGKTRNWQPPEVDEQVVVLAPGGDLCQGVILSGLYTDNAPDTSPTLNAVHYADGSTLSFDMASGTLNINVKGDVNINAGGKLTLTAKKTTIKSPKIRLAGDVIITGDLKSLGEMSLGGRKGKPVARVGDSVAVDARTHRGSITSGSDNVTAR